MKITEEWLKGKNACISGMNFAEKNNLFDLDDFDLIKKLINYNSDESLNYALWIVRRVLTTDQNVKFAIFAAEQVIEIFEKKYPEDKRPREAIEAAKKYLKDKNSYAACAACADSAASAAAYAADAASAAAYAARAAGAADAADAADAAAAAEAE
ncbi:MAG: putative immunity protein, partial [Smithella sp.]